jgi:hypothetical protein
MSVQYPPASPLVDQKPEQLVRGRPLPGAASRRGEAGERVCREEGFMARVMVTGGFGTLGRWVSPIQVWTGFAV